MNDDLVTVLDDLDAFVADLAEVLVDIIERGDADELVRVMVAIRELRADLANTYDLVERRLVIAMDGARHRNVPDVGEVEVKRRTKRTAWDHDALIPAVVARIVDEPGIVWNGDTGERFPPNAIGTNLARRLRDCISFGAGKVTGLRALGLQPDEFCTERDDGYAVTIPRARA